MTSLYYHSFHLSFYEDIILYAQIPWLMKVLQFIQKPLPLLIVLLAVCVFLFVKDRRLALTFLLSVLVAALLGELISSMLKKLIGIGRPATIFLHHINFGAFGFPSAHSTNTMAIAIVCGYFFRHYTIYFILTSLLIGTSRVFTGHHLFLDVLGGFTLGALIGVLVVYLLKKFISYSTYYDDGYRRNKLQNQATSK